MGNDLISFHKATSLLVVFDYDSGAHCFSIQIITAHRRWRVYRGDSSDSKDLLFSAKKAGLVQLIKTELDVFLATNTKEDQHDFKVKGSFRERSCTIYNKDNTIIAQVRLLVIHQFLFFFPFLVSEYYWN